jgi:arginyl-tRNA synthetase
MIKDFIAEILKKAVIKSIESGELGALKELEPKILDGIIIEKARKPEFGDFACNISFLARDARMAPPKIAEIIVKNINSEDNNQFQASVVGGFINLSLSYSYINTIISEVLDKKQDYGKSNQGNKLKVLLEYVSANPTGPLHIGHGRWAALGSSIENILKFLNYDVETEFYINDAGVQINNLGYSLFLRVLQQIDDSVYFPPDKETDPRAANFYPGDYLIEQARQYVSENPGKAELFKKTAEIVDDLYVPAAETIQELSAYGKKLNIEIQKELLTKFKTTFNTWFYESSLHKSGSVSTIIDYLREKDALYDKDGAVWFASSRFLDDQDRVIKKSDGSLTYLTADIAYHKDKLDRGYQHLINIWGADHHGYVARMKSSIQALGYPPDTLEVIIGQMVNLIIGGEQVRMGKRKKMLTLGDLVEEVGVDATRFWMVSRSTDSTLDFDVDLAKSASDENPVYYVQYAHARCSSIIRTATTERLDHENNQTLPPIYNPEELDIILNNVQNKPEILDYLWQNIDEKQISATKNLILHIESFKDTVIKAGRDRSPHYIARYLIDLASCFHSFYSECRVLNLSQTANLSKDLQEARLSLIYATRILLYNGLKLLEVNAPESM